MTPVEKMPIWALVSLAALLVGLVVACVVYAGLVVAGVDLPHRDLGKVSTWEWSVAGVGLAAWLSWRLRRAGR